MANIWRFELEGVDDISGAVFMSHVHYRTDVPILGSEPSAPDALDIILGYFSSATHNLSWWTNVMSDAGRLTEARVRQEVANPGVDIPETASEPLSLPGTLGTPGTDALPTAMCVWFQFGSGNAIRSARGGTHSPPTDAAARLNGSGRWDDSTGYWTNITTLGSRIQGQISDAFGEGGDFNPGVYSRTRRKRGLDPFFFELTSVVPSVKPRWLRRREA